MLELKKIKDLHEKAYLSNQTTREEAADDLVFYWITQWDDQLLSEAQLQYRGQFDIVRKAGRQILSTLKQNPVQPDFKPTDEGRDDDAEVMDGIYRASDRTLSSQEAYDYACQDQVVCGYGAWELVNVYQDTLLDNKKQVISRNFLPEANNTVFWDPNAKKLDKSDARYVTILKAYSQDGYAELYQELTGQELNTKAQASFDNPEESYTFPWGGRQDDKIYVGKFYHREKIKIKVITFIDPLGQELTVREENVNQIMDELAATGYNVKDSKKVDDWKVTCYIASGEDILDHYTVPGKYIPVVPVYGERSIVEGEEHYEGIVRLAKDPQRLRNFQLSYLADITSRSPRPKPMFYSEQIQGFEHMYEDNGADSNYPYYLLNSTDANGNQLPNQAVGVMPEAKVPDSLVQSINLSREAVSDVADPGLPQNIADPDLSGKAVHALQHRLDQQSYIFLHNFKFAKEEKKTDKQKAA